MTLHEDLSYLEQLALLTHIQQLEDLPRNILQIPEFKESWLKLDPQVRNRLSTLWWGHYRAIAWWIKLSVLGIYEPLSQKEFEAFFNVRVEAEFAAAKFFWGRNIYPLLPLAQEFSSLQEFCYTLEVSDFIRWLELAGVTGSPALNKEGRLLGKSEGLELDIAALEDYKKKFELAQSGDLYLKDRDRLEYSCTHEPTLTEVLLADALHIVRQSDGDDTVLATACHEFIAAKLTLQRTVRKKNAAKHLVYYAASPRQFFITQKGVKTPRPEFTPKRGRGRPPKGSSVKKH